MDGQSDADAGPQLVDLDRGSGCDLLLAVGLAVAGAESGVVFLVYFADLPC